MKLKELGYYTGTVTGGYYSGTEKAVRAFQKDHGITVDKRKIDMDGPIRAFGTYALDVKLYTEISGKINLVVSDT